MSWLGRFFLAFMNRHDPGMDQHAGQFGTRPPIGGLYSYEMAKKAVQRAQKRSPSGRAYAKPAKRPPADVVRPKFGGGKP